MHRFALSLALLLCGAALADAPRPPLMVFDFEAKGASALETDAARLAVLRGLRELDVFSVLSSDDLKQAVSLERTRQMFGVEAGGAGPGGVATALGAASSVSGSVVKVGGKLQVDLRLVDNRTGAVLAQRSFGPAAVDALAPELPAVAQQLVGPLLQDQQGALLVTGREEGAEVLVDGTLVASLPLKGALKLPRGTHRLEVRKDGFIAQARSVRIEPNQLRVEEAVLSPSADFADTWRRRHAKLRLGAWIATGAAALAVGSAILVDRAATEPTYQTEFLPRQAALGFQPFPSRLESNAAARARFDACALDATACREQLNALAGQLRGQQALSVGLAVAGVAAAGAAGFFWLSGEDPNRYAGLVASFSVGPSPAFALSGRF